MLYLGMIPEVFHGRDYLSYAGLVVGSKKRSPVGHYKVLAEIIVEFWKFCGVKPDSLLLVEGNDATVVIPYYARAHVLATHVWRRVEMGYEAHDRCISIAICRKRGHEIAIVIKRYLLKPHFFEFITKIAREDHLPGRGGSHICKLIALRVERYEAKKSVCYCHDGFFI